MQYVESFKGDWKKYVVGTLVVVNVFVWLALYQRQPGEVLTVYFLDVGQGDAIFIDSPTHGRVLIDGGATRAVLSELGDILAFGDRRIDVVLATHPDKDHIGGLPEVLARYNVGAYIEPEVVSESSIDDELERRLVERGVPKILAKRGLTVDFGDGSRLVVLFPHMDVSGWETNDASVVARLEYGEHTFLLTGDAGIKTEMLLLGDELIDVDVLKAGHHGSRTSSALAFLQAVTPEYSIISAGKSNSYGHPHIDVLNNLELVGSAVLSTAEEGTIVFKTDGKVLEVK